MSAPYRDVYPPLTLAQQVACYGVSLLLPRVLDGDADACGRWDTVVERAYATGVSDYQLWCWNRQEVAA
jgi:hypothetical protein